MKSNGNEPAGPATETQNETQKQYEITIGKMEISRGPSVDK